jgi:hypothetical protein
MITKSNKRLNKEDRNILTNFVVKNISCEAEQKNLEKAYGIAKNTVLRVVTSRFPAEDMKLLLKFNVAQYDKCIRYGGNYDRDGEFRFHHEDKDIPLVPNSGACNTRRYDWSKEDMAILSAYQLARQALERAQHEKIKAYERLINGSTTFNDVVEIWPAAETLRSRIIPQNTQQRALAVLSQETISMIKADNAGAPKVIA